jgi:hypothetical protein
VHIAGRTAWAEVRTVADTALGQAHMAFDTVADTSLIHKPLDLPLALHMLDLEEVAFHRPLDLPSAEHPRLDILEEHIPAVVHSLVFVDTVVQHWEKASRN